MGECKYCHVNFTDRPIAKEKHVCKTEVAYLKIRIEELEEKADKYDFLLKYYGRCCSVDMGGSGMWAPSGFNGKGRTLDEAIENAMDCQHEEDLSKGGE